MGIIFKIFFLIYLWFLFLFLFFFFFFLFLYLFLSSSFLKVSWKKKTETKKVFSICHHGELVQLKEKSRNLVVLISCLFPFFLFFFRKKNFNLFLFSREEFPKLDYIETCKVVEEGVDPMPHLQEHVLGKAQWRTIRKRKMFFSFSFSSFWLDIYFIFLMICFFI